MVNGRNFGDPGFVGPPSPADRRRATRDDFVGPPSPFDPSSPTFVGPPRPRGGGGSSQGGRPAPTSTAAVPSGPSAAETQAKGQADAEILRIRLQRGQITPIEAREGISRISKSTGQGFSRNQIQKILGGGSGISQLRAETSALRQIPKELRQLEARRLSGKISDSETAGGVRRILDLSRDTSVEEALGFIKIKPQQILESFTSEKLFGKKIRVPGFKIDTKLLDIKGDIKRPPKRRVVGGQETVQVRTLADLRKLRSAPSVEEIIPRVGRGLETASVVIAPGLIGPKFLSSPLGAEVTSQEAKTKEQQDRANIANELIRQTTSGNAIEKRKASAELLRLIRTTDSEIKQDLNRVKVVSRIFDDSVLKINQINEDVESGKIKQNQANSQQDKILTKLKGNGFQITQDGSTVEITHPVYGRLSGFGGSAWANLLEQARKGDTPIKDQSLLAGLSFFNSAFESASTVLAFQVLGGGNLKIVGGAKSTKVLNTIKKVAEPIIGLSFAGASGVSTFVETGEPVLGLSAGLGTLAGFGAAVNSNKLVTKLKNAGKIKLTPRGGLLLDKGGKVTITKTVTVQKKKGQKKAKKKKKKVEFSREQALKEFAKLSRSEQINVIEKQLMNKILTARDLINAKRFLRQSGLTNIQIQDRMAESLRRIEIVALRRNRKNNFIEDGEFKRRLQILRNLKGKILKVTKQQTIQVQQPTLPKFQAPQQLQLQKVREALKVKNLAPQQQKTLLNQEGRFAVQGTFAKQRFAQKNIQKLSQSQKQLSITLQRSKQRSDSLTRQLSATRLDTRQKSLQEQKSKQLSLQLSLTRQISQVKQRIKQFERFARTTRQVKRGRRGQPRRLGPPLVVLPKLGKRSKGKAFQSGTATNQGYHSFARQKGINIRLNKVPLRRRQARDLSSFVVDNSTSRTGGIIKAVGRASQKPRTRIPTGYFSRTSNKYRTFKIVNGKRVPLVNSFIEKRGKALIDTRGEKLGLRASKVVAQRRKKVKQSKVSSLLLFKNKPFKSDNSLLSKNLRKRKNK